MKLSNYNKKGLEKSEISLKKRGVSLSFNTIIIAIIALIVLIVIIAIYTGFIGNSANSIKKPADEAGKNANVAAWCMSSYISGKTCILDKESACPSDCTKVWPDASITDQSEVTCPSGQPIHKAATADETNRQLCCCSS